MEFSVSGNALKTFARSITCLARIGNELAVQASPSQSSLQEITVIATEPTSLPSDAASEIGGKAVELRSYIDPTKDSDSSLHTQLWIDPTEEFVQYTHTGDPIDVTFGVKELKAFLSFCEGCEIDIHLYFEKAGQPILMAPKFGLDDGSTSNFDATLVLATMLVSQLHETNPAEPPQAATEMHIRDEHGTGSEARRERCRPSGSEHPSDHTRIWSDLSGSGARSGNGAEGGQVQGEGNLNANGQREVQRMSKLHISNPASAGGNEPVDPNAGHPEENDHTEEPRDMFLPDRSQINGSGFSQHHPSNWVDADEDDSDEDEENDLCIQATPPYYEEQ